MKQVGDSPLCVLAYDTLTASVTEQVIPACVIWASYHCCLPALRSACFQWKLVPEATMKTCFRHNYLFTCLSIIETNKQKVRISPLRILKDKDIPCFSSHRQQLTDLNIWLNTLKSNNSLLFWDTCALAGWLQEPCIFLFLSWINHEVWKSCCGKDQNEHRHLCYVKHVLPLQEH